MTEREQGKAYGREYERLKWTEALVAYGHHTKDEESPEQALRAAFARLKARLADRERRIRLAVDAIPRGDDMDDATDSPLHNYSRVSERTIQGVEKALNLRKPLPKRGAKRP